MSDKEFCKRLAKEYSNLSSGFKSMYCFECDYECKMATVLVQRDDYESMKKEIENLKEELKEIEKARTITVDVPDSWLIKDKESGTE